MTPIPIQTLTGVRLCCKGCGATVIIPLGAHHAPSECFNCFRPLPGPQIAAGLVKELTWLKKLTDDAAVGIEAALEGEG